MQYEWKYTYIVLKLRVKQVTYESNIRVQIIFSEVIRENLVTNFNS